MTSAKTTTFDEAAYREDLVRAGLDPEDAAILAAKTAAIRQAAVEGATMKQTAPNIIVREPAPPTVRVEGFQSMGDIFGPIEKKAQEAMNAQPAPPEAAKPAAAPAEPGKPATARKTTRRGTKRDELGSSSAMVPMSAV